MKVLKHAAESLLWYVEQDSEFYTVLMFVGACILTTLVIVTTP
jgi:hypothetical protein